ncbi:prepilin-type N-terminal cleavage/methylation domain-containing protein [Planctomycetota bacterium]|nr:prepilin-type N-terminal cleavage/methylation domain-containing protein [Planctomycetota bacterium]
MKDRGLHQGFTLIEVMVVISIIAIILAIGIPSLVSSRKLANETSAIGALKAVATQETLFRENDSDGDGAPDYGTLTELSTTSLVDSVLGSGTTQGYAVAVAYSTTSPETLWYAVANPILAGGTGDRYFVTNHSGVIFYTTSGVFTLNNTNCLIPGNALPVGR